MGINKTNKKPNTFPVSAALVSPIRHKSYQKGHFITGIPIQCWKGKKWLFVKRKCRHRGEVSKIIAQINSCCKYINLFRWSNQRVKDGKDSIQYVARMSRR